MITQERVRGSSVEQLVAAPAGGFPRFRTRNAAVTVAFLTLAFVAYGPAIRAPFDFDDFDAITENASIRRIWPPLGALRPPAAGTPVSARPIANFTFALNYAANRWLGIRQGSTANSPNETIGYHVANVLLHVAAALLLAGIIRRTIRFARVPDDWREMSDRIALTVASIWLLHPLQTEAVDYISQRTELLASTFYLSALYSAIRAWQARNGSSDDDTSKSRALLGWPAVAVVASILGMGSKEVAITIPLTVMLYDRAFLTVDWKTPWSIPARRRLYVALLVTSAGSLALIGAGGWRNAVGAVGGLTWYEYLCSQMWAIPNYVGLLFWPDSLTFDYGRHPVCGLASTPGAAGLVAAGVVTVVAWRRSEWQWIGFLGAWFFLLLAPSSSVVPIYSEVAAERRAYLAIASVVVLLVVAGEWARRSIASGMSREQETGSARRVGLGVLVGVGVLYLIVSGWTASQIAPNNLAARWAVRLSIGIAGAVTAWSTVCSSRRLLSAASFLAVCVAMTTATFRRSALYADLPARWRDGVAKAPANGRAYQNLASAELRRDSPRPATADSVLARAGIVDSLYIPAWVLRAKIAFAEERYDDALKLLGRALQLHPDNAAATEQLGKTLVAQNRPELALPYFRQIAALRRDGESLTRLGVTYLMTRELDSAIAVLTRATTMDAAQIDARRYLGAALIERNRGAEAVPYLEQAARLDSTSGVAFGLLSLSYAESGRVDQAVDAAALAVAKAPDNPTVYVFAGRALHIIGRYRASADYLKRAVQLKPQDPQALTRLGMTEAAMGHSAEARRLFERALIVVPGYPLAREALEQRKRNRHAP